MTRTHQHSDEYQYPEDQDIWELLRAADAYLRFRKFDPDPAVSVTVSDVRGKNDCDSLQEAYDEWVVDSHELRSISASYGTSPFWQSELSVYLHASNLHYPRTFETGVPNEPAVEHPYPPTFQVRATGPDDAEVQGVVRVAMEKAKRGSIEIAVREEAESHPQQPAVSEPPQVAGPVVRSRSLWPHVTSNVTLAVVTIIATVVGGLILAWLLS